MSITKPPSHYYEQASDRLLFRSITLEDIEPWKEFCNQEDYHRFLGMDISIPSATRAKLWVDKQIERKENQQFGQLAIIEKSSGNLIGLAGIIGRPMNDTHEYEITYSLIPRYWGLGYATELANLFRGFALKNIDTKSVISMIHPDNIASIKVAEKNGMVPDGTTEFMGMDLIIYRFIITK
jgi:ribosomal-protein-alanine N-acetyltransferase